MLIKTFGPKKNEITRDWRRLHDGDLHDLSSPPPPHVSRMVKSCGMRCARHVARKEGRRNTYRGLVGRSDGKSSLGRPRRRIYRIILKWIFKKWDGVWTGLIRSMIWKGCGMLWMW